MYITGKAPYVCSGIKPSMSPLQTGAALSWSLTAWSLIIHQRQLRHRIRPSAASRVLIRLQWPAVTLDSARLPSDRQDASEPSALFVLLIFTSQSVSRCFWKHVNESNQNVRSNLLQWKIKPPAAASRCRRALEPNVLCKHIGPVCFCQRTRTNESSAPASNYTHTHTHTHTYTHTPTHFRQN